MREIREVKADVQFFKFTGLLTDIPDWFWELGYSISRVDEENWQICLGDYCDGYMSFGDYVLYNKYFGQLLTFSEESLRESFEINE